MIRGFKRLNAIFAYINKHPLAGKHRLKAYYKFFHWQIGQFLNPREKKIRFIGNSFLMVKKGMAGATGNIYTGLHEFSDMSFLLHLLRKNDLFADIGANIGSYSVLAAGYSGANVLAFEPLPETFVQLQKNISTNNLQSLVRIKNIGIGSSITRLAFTSVYDSGNHVVPSAEKNYGGNSVSVDVFPFDHILENDEVPLLIKMDVEGFETEVLKGMAKTLADKRLKAIIIELNGSGGRYGYDEKDIHNKFINHGFSPYLYDAFKRELTPIDHYGSHNTLYLRDMEFIIDRIKTAPKVFLFSEAF